MFGDNGIPRGPLMGSGLKTPLMAPIKTALRIPHGAEPDQEHHANPVHDRPVQGRTDQKGDAQRRGAVPRSLMGYRAVELTQALGRYLRLSQARDPPWHLDSGAVGVGHLVPGDPASIRAPAHPDPSWQFPSCMLAAA